MPNTRPWNQRHRRRPVLDRRNSARLGQRDLRQRPGRDFLHEFHQLKPTNSVVQGNLIGTDATGIGAIPNVKHGIELALATGTLDRRNAAGARNVISANGRDGVHFVNTTLRESKATTSAPTCTGTGPLGNAIHGVMTGFGANEMIGGATAAQGNVIAFNGGDGVSSRQSDDGRGRAVEFDLLRTPDSASTAATMASRRTSRIATTTRRYSTSANTSPAGTAVSGTLRNASNGMTYTVQFFANPACDSSGAGEGQTFIGETTVTSAGPNTAVPFNVLLNPPVPGGYVVSAVSVGPAIGFGTERFPSEFSTCANVAASLTVVTNALPDGEVAVSYVAPQLSATGGTGSYTWSVTAGSLPNGVSLLPNGNFTGTPTTAGTFNFTVQASDGGSLPASQGLSITIHPAVAVATASLPAGRVGVAYGSSVSASGGSGPFVWSLTVRQSACGIVTGADRRHLRHADCDRHGKLRRQGRRCARRHCHSGAIDHDRARRWRRDDVFAVRRSWHCLLGAATDPIRWNGTGELVDPGRESAGRTDALCRWRAHWCAHHRGHRQLYRRCHRCGGHSDKGAFHRDRSGGRGCHDCVAVWGSRRRVFVQQ